MPRIVIVSPSPLLADGVAVALRTMGDWDVRVGRAEDNADAWVLLGDEIVVRGTQGASAQLAADTGASRLRAQRLAPCSKAYRCVSLRGSPAFQSTSR